MFNCELRFKKENWWCLFKTEDVKPQQCFCGHSNEMLAPAYCPWVCISPRKPADLQNLAPGTHPPFITYNGEVRTDVNKIEEFLEDVLAPPK